ncbi:Pyrroline-5-carboxylate reductase [Halomicronema hongdechloris C2206]|uniref:Pyrroline-5-carboxylate reductase n=2 Tax=Halomicronema hongdechloris TaxID=1209493 RepID=A0A1Z3HUJ3_9CYAN|nr:Pyrroline-5-carboxylate reductase [Halomicronema hongdechloris C2206]
MIGGGVMGEALLSRLVAEQVFEPGAITVGEPQAERRTTLAHQYGVVATADNQQVLSQAEVVLLAVKPQNLAAVAADLEQAASHGSPLLLSILAGIPLSNLQAIVPNWPVIRAMPNTPATVGAGMTVLAPGQGVQPHHLAQARRIFQTVGQVLEVPESLMDAVTGLSGSGPGYVAIMIEALADGGVAAGLPRTVALQLALQTVRGTAELLLAKEWHPAMLKDRVTSPGGTTIAGIAQLEQAGIRSALIEAVRTAAQRSRDLGG